jgi:D-alanyl-D-alanine carboxypeptidase/D-alanyl-D-alanine-endopeptidase (penicillin-binding protein 4)
VARSEYAVVVARLGETAPLVAVNADRLLMLASTTKILTTAAALDRLGEEYRFRTRLYRDTEIASDGTLPGRLIVVGGGDPAVSGRLYDDDPLAVFRPWAESLARQGIRKIQGGLLLDTTFFDGVKVHPDWPEEQEGRWYQAPVSALSYNDNVVLVRASGGLRSGRPAVLGFHPAGPYLLSLIGRVTTTSWRTWMGVRRPAGSRTVIAAGSVGKNRIWMGDITVPDPPLYFAAAFTRVLDDAGIKVEEPPRELTRAAEGLRPGRDSDAPPHARDAAHRSSGNNKRPSPSPRSSRCRAAASGSGERLAEVSDFSAPRPRPGRYQLADGSGRRGRPASAGPMSTSQAVATRWPHFRGFERTMAVSGPDGRSAQRLQTDATYGKVVAKTGTISGVVTLCGYVTARSGQRYVFAILINGGISESRGHAWQDRFLNELARFG